MAYREYAEATNICDKLHSSMWKWGLVIFVDHCGLINVSKLMKLGFVKQLNHLSINAIHIGTPILYNMQILQINSAERTFVDGLS